ncbi:DinB family protein [Paenibacillus sp. N4]|uniref:DinB family protein n=1 Tax=Paenibacillus vietnamensis TaxID=2590547 RepID=UPI001CD0768F|nr:DinB family protein [Paenibacillus vietnamensis]MCA0756002.1 DinB family protein [Paenibacillus vietnamensis]
MSRNAAIINTYLHAYDEIEKEIEGLTEEQLKWKAAPASWSVTEVLAHLADHSIVVSFRIREILAGSEARLPAFNQDAWVAGQKANDGRAQDIIAAAKALAGYNGLLFDRLTDEDWNKTGINFKGEPVAVAGIVPAFVAHVQTHLAQIRRIKQGNTDSFNTSCTI